MKHIASFFVLFVYLWFLSGCNTNPRASFDINNRYITIITEPAGATVTQINLPGTPPTRLGTTPVQEQPVVVITRVTKMRNMPYHLVEEFHRRVDNIIVQIDKEGYQPIQTFLRTDSEHTRVHTLKLKPACIE